MGRAALPRAALRGPPAAAAGQAAGQAARGGAGLRPGPARAGDRPECWAAGSGERVRGEWSGPRGRPRGGRLSGGLRGRATGRVTGPPARMGARTRARRAAEARRARALVVERAGEERVCSLAAMGRAAACRVRPPQGAL